MSYVSPVDFYDSALDAFSTFWAGRTPVSYPNKTFSPEEEVGDDPGGAWCRIFIAGDPLGQTQYSNSVRTDHFIRTGQIVIESYVRQQAGAQSAYVLADAALLFFQQQSIPDATLSNISSPLEVGSDGVWYQISVSATWRYFTDRAA